MKSRILVITGIPSIVFLSFVLLTSLTYAQLPAGWLTHTSDKCKVSFSYPSDWTLLFDRAKDRFNSDAGELAVGNVNSYPKFRILICDIWELPSSEFESYLNDVHSESSSYPGIELIEDTHLIPRVLSNSTIDAYVIAHKLRDLLGIETYDLLHNGKYYSFAYSDLPSHFDSPESKDIRAKILQSINFIK